MNKSKLAVFCALIIAIMCQRGIDAGGGYGRGESQKQEQTGQKGKRHEHHKGQHKGEQRKGEHRKHHRKEKKEHRRRGCKGGTCPVRKKTGATAQVAGAEMGATATIAAPQSPDVD